MTISESSAPFGVTVFRGKGRTPHRIVIRHTPAGEVVKTYKMSWRRAKLKMAALAYALGAAT